MAELKCKHIFKFHVYIYEPLEVFVCTNEDPFKDVYDLYEGEDKIHEKYFTRDRIDELKRKMCEWIMSQDNPFQISCADYDGDGDYEPRKLKREKVKDALLSFRRDLQKASGERSEIINLNTFDYV